jgi:hypothetical protein
MAASTAFIGESGYRSAIKSRKILSVKRFYLFIKPKISGVEARLISENISTLDCLESTNSKYSDVEHIRSQLPSVRYRFLVFCTMLIIVFLLIYQRLQPIKHDSLSESENTTPSLMLHFDKLHELTEVKTPNIPLVLQLSITTDNGNLQVVQCTLPLIINSSQQTYIFDLKHCFPKGIGYKNYAIQEMNFSLLYKDLVIYTGRH